MLFCLYVSCIVNEFALLNICSFPKSSCFIKTVISVLCLLRLLPSPHSPSTLASRMLRSSYILIVYSEDINTSKHWTPVLSLVLVLPTSYSLVCWRPWSPTHCSLNLSELQPCSERTQVLCWSAFCHGYKVLGINDFKEWRQVLTHSLRDFNGVMLNGFLALGPVGGQNIMVGSEWQARLLTSWQMERRRRDWSPNTPHPKGVMTTFSH